MPYTDLISRDNVRYTVYSSFCDNHVTLTHYCCDNQVSLTHYCNSCDNHVTLTHYSLFLYNLFNDAAELQFVDRFGYAL